MLEQVICEHLQSSKALTALLAAYDGKPAVFHDKVPPVEDPLWQGENRYGQIVLSLQIKDDPGRMRNGGLVADVLGEKDTQLHKDMIPIVRNSLDGYFFVSDGQVISLRWVNQSPDKDASAASCESVRMRFRVYCYPTGNALTNHPATLLGSWSKGCMKHIGREAYFIDDRSSLPTVFKPAAEKPALYWRLTKIKPCSWMKDTAAAGWRTASVECHVIIPGHSEAESDLVFWLDQMIGKTERIERDEFFMFISKANHVDLTVISMKQGQLTINAAYGIPAEEAVGEKLQNVSIEMK